MTQYRHFQPTGFDIRGLGLPDRQDWVVLPYRRTRDGGPDNRRFWSALRRLGGESDTVEVHRFRHWAIGWFEILLVAPERAKRLRCVRNRKETA